MSIIRKIIKYIGKERLYLFLLGISPLGYVKYLQRYFWFHTTPILNDGKVRLNLGCGDKILEGYINVDVVESRKGNKPDVLCDLHDLKFDDNYADEILSVHVVEHFYRWEIDTVLKEWMRVLKPGGKIIIECPNIISASKFLMKETKNLHLVDSSVKNSLWVFYGDPGWKDPYMIHRWGYSPDSLKQLLLDVGFLNVTRQPALYKKREPRDMRVEGCKEILK